jgi:putative acetyltransferase
MPIRPYQTSDALQLLAVFNSAVHTTAAADYSPTQLNAWAPPDRDQSAWAAHMQAIKPWVLEQDAIALAYASLDTQGYIDHFFVRGGLARQGLGSQLMAHLLVHAHAQQMPLLSADVSRTAQPFFARHGFVVMEQRNPVRAGVVIPNALMHKQLMPHADAAMSST